MTFVLHVDSHRWRAHTGGTVEAVRAAIGPARGASDADTPAALRPTALGDLVPVAKGNGYGVGNARLVAEAARLGLTRVAVGTVFEAHDALEQFDGDVLVLTPFEPADPYAAAQWVELAHSPYADRLVRTVASREAWDALVAGPGPARVVLEALTSMGRFGLPADAIADLLADAGTVAALTGRRVRLEGLALHLPLVQPSPYHRAVPGARWKDAVVAPEPPAGSSARVREALAWGLGWQSALADLSERVSATGDGEAVTELTEAAALWVSHLDDVELASLRGALPDIALFPRIGTRLWLGDRGALVARGTVLAVHAVGKGQTSGYRQRRASREGAVVVIGGGTAHGVAMEAPSAVSSMRQRVVVAGTGILDAAGRALSPFHVGGSQVWFAEPPHMQVSLVRVPRGIAVPAVGDEVDVDVRLTGIAPDRVVGLD
jgi:hypothetical protein